MEAIIENSIEIVKVLKKDNSGSTVLRLGSVLQIDPITVEKSLDHLERLGVIEKRQVSAEETIFFYKKADEADNS